MTGRRKGFTLVEIIVVLVILAILAAILIPSMTGWTDKAVEKRLLVACRTCVSAAQTLASEAYGETGSTTPPEGAAVIELADLTGKGTASNISLDAASVLVNILTYSEGAESMTYMRLPTPHFISGTGIAAEMSTASNWTEEAYKKAHPNALNADLVTAYAATNPSQLSQEQLTGIFGDLPLQDGPFYVYPMAISGSDGKLFNVQYVTNRKPTSALGGERYYAAAVIIDGETYISTNRVGNTVKGHTGANGTFQQIMNKYQGKYTFNSAQEFADLITTATPGHMPNFEKVK